MQSKQSYKHRVRSLLAASGLTVAAFAAPAYAGVDIQFEGYVADKMDRITSIERNREGVFRDYRTEGTRTQVKPRDKLRVSYFAGTEWGNERIFPSYDDYNVPDLIKEMMERGIKEADPDFNGTVQVTIDKLRIKDFSLAVISSHTTQMSGTVKVLDAAGNVTAEHDIWAGIVPEYSASNNYKGRNYAYVGGAVATRVGPIAAEFTEKALETLYPDYDAPGLVILSSR
ncbi:hypothetical protein [Kordiimonas aestuarii]|uniref:hypothetical protein n=1 Tax=Kordiimonas aestuarii TaxID=1005925 RepID=UPI0021D3E1D8|nr:hypothetical protein [Kordiimonas aestuarii]